MTRAARNESPPPAHRRGWSGAACWWAAALLTGSLLLAGYLRPAGPKTGAAKAGWEVYHRFIRSDPAIMWPEGLPAVPAGAPGAGKVLLGGDMRNALLAPVGTSIAETVRVDPAAALRFSYAILPSAGAPVRFSIVVETADGAAVVFDRQVPPWAGRQPKWSEAVIQLDDHAGETVRLELRSTGEERSQLALWGHPELVRPRRDAARRSVLLIVLDTLRADHLSLYGYGRPTSPSLDRWTRANAAFFRRTVAAAPWTLPSHVSLFSGQDALRHGVNFLPFPGCVPDRLRLLAEAFREAGYSTAALTAGGAVAPEWGLAQGFDVYRARERKADSELADGMRSLLEWLDEAPRPFFAFFHTYEMHSPYHARQPHFAEFGGRAGDVPLGYATLRRDRRLERTRGVMTRRFVVPFAGESGAVEERDVPAEGLELVRSLYDSQIAFADAQLERLFRALQSKRLSRETIVVITSDHGESLGEHGLGGHDNLYDDNLLVPLIIATPERSFAGRIIEEQVRLIDVAPTLFELAGLEKLTGVDGRSLVPLLAGGARATSPVAWSYAPLTQRGVSLRIDNRLKYILANAAAPLRRGREELYDLSSDPEELRNRADADRRAASLAQLVEGRLEEAGPGLRLEFRNTEDRPLRASFHGLGAPRQALTTPSPGALAVELLEGDFVVEVPPRGVGTVFVESYARGLVEVILRWGGASEPPFDWRVDLDEREVRRRVEWSRAAARWREARAAGPGAQASVLITTREAVPAVDERAARRALRRRLGALGYLD